MSVRGIRVTPLFKQELTGEGPNHKGEKFGGFGPYSYRCRVRKRFGSPWDLKSYLMFRRGRRWVGSGAVSLMLELMETNQ